VLVTPVKGFFNTYFTLFEFYGGMISERTSKLSWIVYGMVAIKEFQK